MQKNGGGSLTQLSISRAKKFLRERACCVSQKTLDRDRQAVQAVLLHTGKLKVDQRLPVLKADKQQVLNSRNYTREQLNATTARMSPHNALAAEITFHAGLRAHELLTIRPSSEQPADSRVADPGKFRVGVIYTVIGKGGLCREISIPPELAKQLEDRRLVEPQRYRDRGIFYTKHYDIGGGQAFSQAFTRAAKSALGFSNGAHGARHSYAQERLHELQKSIGDPGRSKEIVSQELGHFRPDITDTYLR